MATDTTPPPAPHSSSGRFTLIFLGLLTAVLAAAMRGGAAGPGAGRLQTSSHLRTAPRAAGLTPPPARGALKEILGRVYRSFGENRTPAVAAGITFFGLLAIFPAIAAFLAIYGLFADAGAIQGQLSSLSGILPEGAIEIIGDQIKQIAGRGGSTLGLAFAVSFVTSLWSANSGLKALIDGLNIAYGRSEKRGFVGLNLASLAFTLGTIIALLLAMGLFAVVPAVPGFLNLGGGVQKLVAFARWPASLLTITLALGVLYRYGPSPPGGRWRWVTPGSAVAAALWLVASAAFSFYVSHFGSYNATYGSLGAAVGFMTWIWLSAIVVLIGAELNGELERSGQPSYR
jgi:membrane protein